jgi:subtilisin-like proprotein convertase family protein
MLAAALLALTMMPVAMTGCGGPQCGANTTENGDGECVPDFDAVSCADGTTLSEGQCVLDTTGCGANTTLEDGVCVPAESLCGEKTTFNPATGACEAAEECGAGTSANADGECVPAAGACAAGTTLNADGTCEVASAACGAGTTLDAATGTCALGDMVCGDNTVLANGACTIIADACEAGTTFNEGTGTCLPEAVCKPGDAISGGLCVTPAEKLFADATVEVPAGKTDPNDGGTPVELTLPAPGASVIAKGTIEAPYDDDTDPETPDIQDIDYLSFTGTRGQLVRLTLAPTPDSIPLRATVTLDSEDVDWERSTSTIGFGSARYMVLPEDGTYIIEVAPNLGGGFDPVGSDDYDYAIELEAIALGAPAAASAGIAGDFTDYTDNFYVLDQTNAGELIGLVFSALGSGVDGVFIHVFSGDGAGNYTYERTAEAFGDPASVAFPAFTSDVAIVIGYGRVEGSEIGYEVSLEAPTNLQELGPVAAGASVSSTSFTFSDSDQYYSFDVQPGQILEIVQDEVDVALVDLFGPSGVVLDAVGLEGFGDSGSADAPYALYAYAPSAGDYLMYARDESVSLIDVIFTVSSSTPLTGATLGVGDSDSFTSTTALEEFRREYRTYELSEAALLVIDARNGGDGVTDVFVFDATTGEEVFAGESLNDPAYEGEDPVEVSLPAGSYIVGVGAEDDEDLDSGYTLDVRALEQPAAEVEPNDDAANATSFNIATQYATGSIEVGNLDVFSFQYAAGVPSGSYLQVTVSFDDAANHTCRILDGAGAVLAEDTTSGDECVLDVPVVAAATDYFIELSSDASAPTSYDVRGEVLPGTLEIEPNDDASSAATVDLETSFILASFEAGNADFYSFQVSADLAAGEFWALRIQPDASFNTTDTYTYRVSDSSGVIAEQVGVATDGWLPLSGLTAAETYTLEVSTTATGPIDYRVDATLLTGALESEPNDDLTTNANDLGTFTPGTPIVAYGSLTTDGTASDVDAHQITLGSALSGESLVINIDDAGGSGGASVDLDVYASGDLTTPVASRSGIGSTFQFPDLAADTYTLVLTRTDTDVTETARYNVTAFNATTAAGSSSPASAIVDNTSPGTSDTLNIAGSCVIASIVVPVDIAHNWIGDLEVTLTSPSGTTVVLHDNSGGSSDDIIGVYGDDLTPVENLSALHGEDAMGDWTFYAEDNAGGIAGTLNSWGIELLCQ